VCRTQALLLLTPSTTDLGEMREQVVLVPTFGANKKVLRRINQIRNSAFERLTE
jgi:hypothetical protein